MDRAIGLIVVLAILALIFAGLVIGWRGRTRRQGTLPAPAGVPADPGAVLLTADVLYVATTRADAPLDRIAVQGLGFRSRALIEVTTSGITLGLAAQPPAFIAALDLRGVGRATWTIDRVVNRDGLVFVRWSLGGTEVDSYLRADDPGRLVAAIQTLLPGSIPDPLPNTLRPAAEAESEAEAATIQETRT